MKQYAFDAVIFDLDGVITKTARVHAHAWKAAFDQYLRLREERDGEPFKEFTHDADYLPYVDGKPRYNGVKSFLESRGIHVPFGEPSDTPDKETVCGIGNKKNDMFREVLKAEGADVFSSSVQLIQELKNKGIRIGVASSSKNCKDILESAGLDDLFETRVDGVVSHQLGLKGKPEGDIFVTAARNIGAIPARSVVVEDATSGVQAGRNGGFGLVLGVARINNESDLLEGGADIVVQDLSEITIDVIESWFHKKAPSLFTSWDSVDNSFQMVSTDLLQNKQILINSSYFRSGKDVFQSDKKLIFFLDYDGTLTPIVDRPELAVMGDEMRDVVKHLSQKHMVAIVSGRMREDVEKLVGIKGLFYAGSHGFDIQGPEFSMIHPQVKDVIPVISQIIEQLKQKLGTIPGLLIEEKKFSVAVHYRLVDETQFFSKIKDVVDTLVNSTAALCLMSGKKVFEILPDIEWNKGMAIRWIMDALNMSWEKSTVIYIGDDVTDEFAFRVIRTRGTGILVAEQEKESAADFQLSSPSEVKKFFGMVSTSS